ncbi:MAG: alpha/beta hydrolase fold domain-containing protein [Clostridia bacterium]|nr:alpha/beta hydrolase fold domain-containing protein [Clostridia bacterium]
MLPIPQEYLAPCTNPGQVTNVPYGKKFFVLYTPVKPAKRILYLIHGGGGDQYAFFCPSFLNMVDHLIAEEKMEPLFIVSPCFYSPEETDKRPASSGVAVKKFCRELREEIMPLAEREAGLRFEREDRVISGFSMGGVTAWYAFLQALDLFYWFLPLSGDCWVCGETGGGKYPEETAKALRDAALAQGNPDFRIRAITGSKDIAFPNLDAQIKAMAAYPDVFGRTLIYDVWEGGVHDYETIFRYLYNALPRLFGAPPRIDMDRTLGEYLSDPRIRLIAPDAITNWDLSKEAMWNKTLRQIRQEHFGGGLANGFERLFAAADGGNWYEPLYTQEEIARDETKKGASLVWLPSSEPDAKEKPYILLVPGGGFVNVWNLTEGWPVAAQFNRLGYNVFILSYRVAMEEHIIDREMEDFARALRRIRENEEKYSVRWDRYIPCGFSAGGYLVCLWNVAEKGYAAFGLPKPQAVFPLYPVVSWKLDTGDDDNPSMIKRMFGCTYEEACGSPFEIPDHARDFPPCAVFVAAGDELAAHARLLARTLEGLHIPCRLEIGPTGGHGFADGSDMCMAGWTERAVRWFERL